MSLLGPPAFATRALVSGSDDGLSPVAKAYRSAAPWLNAVWQFVGLSLLGVGVGYGIDSQWAHKPVGLLVGGLSGTVLGFLAFIRVTNRLLEKKK